MVLMDVKKILLQLKSGKISMEQALEKLRHFPYQDLDFAKLDNHRQLRRGFPEVIYCANKSTGQVVKIFRAMLKHHSTILATRANFAIYNGISSFCPKAEYSEIAKTIVYRAKKSNGLNFKPKNKNSNSRNSSKNSKAILVVSAGTSDIPIAEEAAVTAEAFGHNVERLYDVGVAGIHRLFKNKKQLDKANVLIVVAGMDGALPSVVSGLVSKPVIAVPTSVGYGASFKGISALLTMLNCCAPGVAVVNIDNGFGAGYLAAMVNK